MTRAPPVSTRRWEMSLVFPSREVAAVGFEGQQVSASPEVYVKLPVYPQPGEAREKEKGNEELDSGFCLGRRGNFIGEEVLVKEEEESADSSSIGEQSSLSLSSSTVEDREDVGEEEVQSKLKKDSLGSLESLEESLPIKRGLSNFFTGKSKSFASLWDASAVKDLVKPENPFNKRRRILMSSCKPPWPRRASYASLIPSPPPLLSTDGSDDEDGEEGVESSSSFLAPLPPHVRKLKNFRSPRSFSLSDLQHA